MTVIDFPLPDLTEVDRLLQELVAPEKLNLGGLGKEQLLKACLGLSRTRIRRVLASALAAKQQVNESDIDTVLEEKKQAIRQQEKTSPVFVVAYKNCAPNVGENLI